MAGDQKEAALLYINQGLVKEASGYKHEAFAAFRKADSWPDLGLILASSWHHLGIFGQWRTRDECRRGLHLLTNATPRPASKWELPSSFCCYLRKRLPATETFRASHAAVELAHRTKIAGCDSGPTVQSNLAHAQLFSTVLMHQSIFIFSSCSSTRSGMSLLTRHAHDIYTRTVCSVTNMMSIRMWLRQVCYPHVQHICRSTHRTIISPSLRIGMWNFKHPTVAPLGPDDLKSAGDLKISGFNQKICSSL